MRIRILLIVIFCITVSIIVEILNKELHIHLSYKFIADIIHNSFTYFGQVGIPLLLILSSKDIINYVDKHYWKNMEDLSKSERRDVPFPVEFEEKTMEQLINNIEDYTININENIDYVFRDEDELQQRHFEIFCLSIPNSFTIIQRDILHLRVLHYENLVKDNPSKFILQEYENAKNKLEEYIKSTNLND